MGFSAERNGFVTVRDMCNAVVADMITNGFRLVYPTDPMGVPDPNLITDLSTQRFVVDATTVVDPLGDEQPWRIYMEPMDNNWLRLHVATPLQIQVNFGQVEITQTYHTTEDRQPMSGLLGNTAAPPSGEGEEEPPSVITDSDAEVPTVSETQVDFVMPGSEEQAGWTTRLEHMIEMYIGSDAMTGRPTGTSYPFSYRLSISDHGVSFCTWMEAQDQFGEMFSWFVVQRPVHPKTGEVLVYGKTPLFCVYSIQGGGQLLEEDEVTGLFYTYMPHKNIKYFVVREKDVNTQGSYRDATKHTRYGPAIINPLKQISFTEDNEYIINFPNGLCSDRYAYIHEMDMIGYTSGRVISQWTMADVHMYGETEADGSTPKKRRYQALHCNEPLNEGMRILMLVDGGGVHYACPPIETSIGTHPPIPPFIEDPVLSSISLVVTDDPKIQNLAAVGFYTVDEQTTATLEIIRTLTNTSSTRNTDFTGMTLTSSHPAILSVSSGGVLIAPDITESAFVTITVTSATIPEYKLDILVNAIPASGATEV